MLVIKSELYDVIPCTSLGIVPVHYTFMYMDFDIPFTLFLMLVIKSELYDVIPCTSLGIVPVHYTFMYMDEREQQIGENTDIVDFSL